MSIAANNKKFTPSTEQINAAKNKGNTIVSAGAGCGKTATMIERIVDKISQGASLSDMLIVTFTRASAADIRTKLSAKFSEILQTDTSNSRIREAQYAMPVSDIGTLHSFCQKLIRSYGYEVGIDPGRTVCDESEAKNLKKACVRAAVSEARLSGDKYFIDFCDMLSDRRNDRETESVVYKVLEYALSLPQKEQFFDKIKSDADYFSKADEIINQKRVLIMPELYALNAEVEAAGLKNRIPITQLIEYLNGRTDCPTLPRGKFTPSDEEQAALLETFKIRFAKIKDKCVKTVASFDAVEKAKLLNSAPYAAALMHVSAAALELYDAKKKDRGVIDYSDLEHGARKILENPKCLAEITSHIKYVFIDEYQDVNPLQNSIADKFRQAKAEIFLVGDVKQSIYGFRRCEPTFFVDALGSKDYRRFDLTENYRSSPEIIDFINEVFSAAMTAKLGGVDYADGRNALKANGSAPGHAELVIIDRDAEIIIKENGCANLNPIDGIEDSKNGGDIVDGLDNAQVNVGISVEQPDDVKHKPEEVYSVIRALPKKTMDPEAYYIAKRILELTDPDGEHKANFGDITVLLRSTKSDFAARLFDTLGSLGIPVSIGRQSKPSNFPEAVALLDIARCVDTSMDDLALYTALRSPMGGFSDGELAEIAREGGKTIGKCGRFHEPFWRKAAAYNGALKERLDKFFELREKFRTYSLCHDAADTLGYITSETDYFRHVYSMSGNGGHSAAAVEALMSCAAEKKCDLHSFIAYCSDPDFELVASAVGDTVKIETIHASKGIEYDYCFVAECTHLFNFDDSEDSVIIDKDGIALKIPDGSGGIIDSIPYVAAQAESKQATRSEEMRLMYVALTRAKKMLVVTAKNKQRATSEPECFLDFFASLPNPETSITVEKYGAAAPPPIDTDALSYEVRKRCSFVYPREINEDGSLKDIDPDTEESKIGARTFIPIKTSVTAVAESEDEYEQYVISDDDRVTKSVRKNAVMARGAGKYDGLTSSELARLRGTAYHRAMELIDFVNPDFDKIRGEIDDVELIDERAIIKAAAVMKDLTDGALFVGRERYFIADIHVAALGGQSVLVQGVIDLLIVDKSNNATIVDYKTTAESGMYSESYKTQLDLYAKAVEKSTPFKVVKKLLYSFDKGFIPIYKQK